jgi:hypothetical protein
MLENVTFIISYAALHKMADQVSNPTKVFEYKIAKIITFWSNGMAKLA